MPSYLKTSNLQILLFGILVLLLAPFSLAQLNEETCAKLKDFGRFYENPEGKALQSAKLFLSYQHQIGYLDGSDNAG
ncbi:MAG: hypothetical protein ACKVJ1_10435, partial [Verrucomicrobiia bacterium]